MTLSTKTVLTGLGTEVTWEDQDSAFEHETTDKSEFASLFEQTQGEGENIKEGSIVKGKVVNLNDDYVLVDIGHKTDGEIPIYEFKDAEGTVTVTVGDEVEVYLDCFEDNYGDMILSRERAEMLRAWDRISEAYENSQIIEGAIISRVKGGLSVDIGVKAFLPGSQVDLRPVRNLDKLIGQTFEFKIIKFNKKRGNIVLSRRVLLEQDREKMRGETLENLAEGSTVKGIIKNITDYGAFVDLGGIDGLLHITDMSWEELTTQRSCSMLVKKLKLKSSATMSNVTECLSATNNFKVTHGEKQLPSTRLVRRLMESLLA